MPAGTTRPKKRSSSVSPPIDPSPKVTSVESSPRLAQLEVAETRALTFAVNASVNTTPTCVGQPPSTSGSNVNVTAEEAQSARECPAHLAIDPVSTAVYLMEPSGSPEKLADSLEAFLARLVPSG